MDYASRIRLRAIAAASLLALASCAHGHSSAPDTATAQAGGSSQPPTAHVRGRRTVHNGALIAYSTAPANDQHPAYYGGAGSDVFVTRVGGHPTLVAGRGSDSIWNVCPAFSPDGTKLAFGRKAPSGSAIVVVDIADDGAITAPRVTLKVAGTPARCPEWSSDGSRLAYVDANGSLVVRGLDGSRRQWTVGDPTIHDFDRIKHGILSPTGELIARRPGQAIVVSRPDGSHRRVIKEYLYGIAGWSPDGHKLLVMSDVGGNGFMMRAVSVDPPFTSMLIVDFVPVNNARSWPAYGDVSWQPAPQP